MGKVLICAEKPDQMKKISLPFSGKTNGDHIAIAPCSTFPEGAIVISACGHIMQAFEPGDYNPKYKEWSLDTLPIIPEKFKLKVDPSKSKYFQAFKKYINDPQISFIVNAGDPEVEGQLLIDEILYHLNNKKPVKRLWTTSLTSESIIQAFKNMKNNSHYKGYYLAGVARQRADWIVGLSSTRALTLLLKEKGINKTFSVGRVQTALMGVIYQREKEIDTFVCEPYWDCMGTFTFGERTVSGNWFNEDGEHIFSREAAQILICHCKGNPVRVYSVKSDEKNIRPPQFFNLSALQMEANRLFGMSPANVLSIAQSLYDKSLITYPRTDSKHLTPGEAKWLPTILSNLSKLEAYKDLVQGAVRNIATDKRFVDESKVSDHYALCLTEEEVNPLTLSKGEQLIYDLIAKSVIAAHYPDFVFDFSEIVFAVKERFTFKSKGKVITENGWKNVYLDFQKLEENEEEEELPNFEVGEIGQITEIDLKEGVTKPPNRFTEGDLISVMSNAGYYVKDKEGFQNKELSLGTEATRAGIITTIKKRYIEVDKNKVYLLPEGRLLIESLGPESLLASAIMTGNMERYLTEFKKGNGNLDDFLQRTEKLTRMIIEKLKKDSSDWEIDSFVKEIQESEVIGSCKICGEPVIDKGEFYGCSGYEKNNCKFKISKTMYGKKISKDNIIKLLERGQTSLIKGFKSKGKDKTYDAILEWNPNKQAINLSFPNPLKNKT